MKYLRMKLKNINMSNLIKIGIPSKGRLRNDVLNIFKKMKLKLSSEKGKRDLVGYISGKKNIKIIYLHAREIIESLGDGSLDIGFSGYDLLRESEQNIQNKIKIVKKYEFGKANLVIAIPDDWIDVQTIADLEEIAFEFKDKKKKKLRVSTKSSGRSILELISQPRFLQALVASAFGYAIMTFLMTATPLSMHVMEKMSLSKTGLVIQFHVVAMFLPSLITGNLVKKFGHSNIMYAGVFLYSITIIASFFDQTYYNYMFALIFLGLGWNFLFISGTSLLVLTYKEEEKFKAQGLNDFIVYSVHATGSLSAGVLIVLTNWKMMNLICIPFLIIIILTTLRADILSKK